MWCIAAQTAAAATPESKPAVTPKGAPPQPTAARMRGGQRPMASPNPSPAKPGRARLVAGPVAKKQGGAGAKAGSGGGAKPVTKPVPDPVPRPETPLGAALTAAGEAAVGARVAVWWPEDKVFYKVRADSLSWLCWGTFPAHVPR